MAQWRRRRDAGRPGCGGGGRRPRGEGRGGGQAEVEDAPDRWVPPVGEREREERAGHWWAGVGRKRAGRGWKKKEGRKMGRGRKWAGLDRFFPSLFFSFLFFFFFSNQFFKSFLNQIFYIFSNSNFHTNFSNYF
jgi:hypothetical protein